MINFEILIKNGWWVKWWTDEKKLYSPSGLFYLEKVEHPYFENRLKFVSEKYAVNLVVEKYDDFQALIVSIIGPIIDSLNSFLAYSNTKLAEKKYEVKRLEDKINRKRNSFFSLFLPTDKDQQRLTRLYDEWLKLQINHDNVLKECEWLNKDYFSIADC